MVIMIHATYPTGAAKAILAAYGDLTLPQRPRYATEIASFIYADQDGYHTVLLIEIPSDKATELLRIQTARHRHMQSRVEGLKIEIKTDLSLQETIALTWTIAASQGNLTLGFPSHHGLFP
jgi:hypothetical protein